MLCLEHTRFLFLGIANAQMHYKNGSSDSSVKGWRIQGTFLPDRFCDLYRSDVRIDGNKFE
ncbi:hypothetical protein JW835_10925 [bacterium]|nr:hypothetical protein [bacterium]